MSFSSKIIKLMNDNNFERLLSLSIKLLTAGHFLNELLNYNSILIIGIRRSNFNVEVAAEHYTFNNC